MKDASEAVARVLELLQSWRLALKFVVGTAVFVTFNIAAEDQIYRWFASIGLEKTPALIVVAVTAFSLGVLLVDAGLAAGRSVSVRLGRLQEQRAKNRDQSERAAALANYMSELLPRLNGGDEAVLSAFYHSDLVDLTRSYFLNALVDKGVLIEEIDRGPSKCTYRLADPVVPVVKEHFRQARQRRFREYLDAATENERAMLEQFFQLPLADGSEHRRLTYAEYLSLDRLQGWNLVNKTPVPPGHDPQWEMLAIVEEAVPALEQWRDRELVRRRFRLDLSNVDRSGGSGSGASNISWH